MNSIGLFSFLSLEGVPVGIGREVVTLTRPGVDGVALWRTGQRGRPFTLRSSVDGYDLAHATYLYTGYKTLIGADPVDLKWNGIWITTPLLRAAVLDVTPVTIEALVGGVGGQSYPSQGWVEADWKLLLVDVS